ncbi:MAG: HEAT repeat domain-containing protein [Candidatus Poribacteria bacterium]|jgi:HEAT repeat protein|nr:HEAT repeat domain-containing protein [Candidatus Poribacteria bacterium]
MKITDLIRQLKHEHKHVHRAAAETLGKIGPEANITDFV